MRAFSWNNNDFRPYGFGENETRTIRSFKRILSIALYKIYYINVRIRVYSLQCGVVSTSAPPWRANSIYHRPIFRPTFIVTHAVLVWPRGRREGHRRGRYGSRGRAKDFSVARVHERRGTLYYVRRAAAAASKFPLQHFQERRWLKMLSV